MTDKFAVSTLFTTNKVSIYYSELGFRHQSGKFSAAFEQITTIAKASHFMCGLTNDFVALSATKSFSIIIKVSDQFPVIKKLEAPDYHH